MPAAWSVRWRQLSFELKLTEFGHLGLFPEHAENWPWLSEQIAHAGRELKVLNLFAYTGGATLAMAAAGAQVVHVDSARSRRGLGAPQCRAVWIVGGANPLDRRGRSQICPPRIEAGGRPLRRRRARPAQLWPWAQRRAVEKSTLAPAPLAVRDCFELTRDRLQFMLLSCHTPGFSTQAAHDLFMAAAARRVRACRRSPRSSYHRRAGRRATLWHVSRWETLRGSTGACSLKPKTNQAILLAVELITSPQTKRVPNGGLPNCAMPRAAPHKAGSSSMAAVK